MLALVLAGGAGGAAGQSATSRIQQGRYLIEQYRTARLEVLARQHLGPGGAYLPARPPAPLAYASAEVAAMVARLQPPVASPPPAVEVPAFTLTRVQPVKKLERGWFETQYQDVAWAYLGSNYWTPIDTTHTRVWRAKLEATYGPPTKTLAELDFSREIRLEEYIQFEYWFVLNDSIPVRVMDVNGPFERGLVVSTDHRYRNILFPLRQAFLMDVATSAALEPYVDYYFHAAVGTWYRTGYDGRRFFLEPIRRPNLERGRPWMEAGER
ncbi:hypothetical protein AWN76_018550 [Rhodothermaceae bacterium RA]|nr:hypothetical protein AWN76_018550 [Rhodothermaceae bacterium RA]